MEKDKVAHTRVSPWIGENIARRRDKEDFRPFPVEAGLHSHPRNVFDLIEEKILRGKKRAKVFLRVNGVEIPLSPFVQESIKGTVRGMVSSLKGCALPQGVDLQILPD